jgi:hypothetical protein
MAWRRSDHDRDGQLESTELHRWIGDLPLERLTDSDGDGYLDSIVQWHYDAAGQLAQKVSDMDADAVIDARVAYRR